MWHNLFSLISQRCLIKILTCNLQSLVKISCQSSRYAALLLQPPGLQCRPSGFQPCQQFVYFRKNFFNFKVKSDCISIWGQISLLKWFLILADVSKFFNTFSRVATCKLQLRKIGELRNMEMSWHRDFRLPMMKIKEAFILNLVHNFLTFETKWDCSVVQFIFLNGFGHKLI